MPNNYYIDEENNGLETPKQEVKIQYAGQSNEAIVNTAPKTAPTNTPDIDDVKDIAAKQSATDWEKTIKEYVVQNGNTTEIGGNTEIDGNLVTNGNATFHNRVNFYGIIGQTISQSDFLENLHENCSIDTFSAYKIGQFVFLTAKISCSSFTANDVVFSIKSPYRSKLIVRSVQDTNNWGSTAFIYTKGEVHNAATSTGGSFTISIMYQVA